MVLLCFALYFLAENGRINAFATYLLALSVIAMLLFAPPRRAIRGAGTSLPVVVALLAAYLGLSAAWSGTAETGRHLGYAALIMCFVTGTFLACRHFPRFLTVLLIAIVTSAALSAVLSVHLHVAYPDYQPLPEPRLYGFGRLSNPVISATSYGFATIIACHLFLYGRSTQTRIALAFTLAIFLAAIVLSGSRTVWLALAVAIGTVLALRHREHAWWILPGVVIVTGMAMIVLLGFEEVTRRALSFRPEIWSEFISRTLGHNLLLGAGSGTDAHFQLPELRIQHPHSVFVSTFYFGGLIGLTLLLAMIGLCVWQVRRSPPCDLRELTMLTGLFGLTVGFFDGDNILTKIDYLWWICWFPVTICLLLSARERQPA